MKTIPEYGTKEFPIHKSDFVLCPMAMYYSLMARQDKTLDVPTTRMLQGLAIDFTAQVAVNAQQHRNMETVTLVEIGKIYEWACIYMSLRGMREYGQMEKPTPIQESVYNFAISHPPSVAAGWPFDALASICQCHFKYEHENLWYEGTIDEVYITTNDIVAVDWKLSGASQFSGFEALIYSRATQFPMVSREVCFTGNWDNKPFTFKDVRVELHVPASRFFQMSMLEWTKYKKKVAKSADDGKPKSAGDYRGQRFYENHLDNAENLYKGISNAVNAVREGLFWPVEGMHCYRCKYRFLCFETGIAVPVESFELTKIGL